MKTGTNNPGHDGSADTAFSGCSLKPLAFPAIHVVAGALFDSAGRVLIAERPAGKHMEGQWEFPGGKLEQGEPRFEGLQREIKEELGVEVVAAIPLVSYEHQYPGKRVLLDLWRVTGYLGKPESREGQRLRWVAVADLGSADLLEADRPMISALQGTPAE